jgi:serine/threonine protein kinase
VKLPAWAGKLFGLRPPSQLVTPGADVVDGYNLIKPIGKGNYGEVWLARSQTGRLCAIKFVYRDRFSEDASYEREFDGLKRYEPISRSSPGMLHVLHVNKDQERGRFYYVMDAADDNSDDSSGDSQSYVPKTLRAYMLKRGTRLPVREGAQIAEALATALARLHGQGVIHRDIKPENVMFVQEAPRLGDIGCCSTEDDAQSYVGTKGYIPPEGPGTRQADIFALGRVFYEMVAAQQPKACPGLPRDLIRELTKEQLASLQEVLNAATHTDITERHTSAEDFARALQRLQGAMVVKRRQAYWRSVGRRVKALFSAIAARR